MPPCITAVPKFEPSEKAQSFAHCLLLKVSCRRNEGQKSPDVFTIEGFPGGSVTKNMCAMQETQETWVQSLGQENPL